MKLRWLWHACGIVATVYVLLFWLLATTPLSNGLPNTEEQVLVTGCIALVLSLLAAILASKRWYAAAVAIVLTLLFALYAASV